MKTSEGGKKIVVRNRKASHLFFIEDTIEAGLELRGTEVKSLRQGRVSMADAYCKIQNDELFLYNLNIAPYDSGGYVNHEPTRRRRLLLHKREIAKLRTKLILRGYTLIPLSIYFKRGWAKTQLGLARGKHKTDKRANLRQKELQKEVRSYR